MPRALARKQRALTRAMDPGAFPQDEFRVLRPDSLSDSPGPGSRGGPREIPKTQEKLREPFPSGP
eukprot:3710664-Pyramimonas_sp.AAC.1